MEPVLKYLFIQVQYGDIPDKVLNFVESQLIQADVLEQVKQEY